MDSNNNPMQDNSYMGYQGDANGPESYEQHQQMYPNHDQSQQQNMVYSHSNNAFASPEKTISYQQKERQFNHLRKVSENEYCFDCGRQNPDCVSTKNGVFICGNCMDVHIQMIQSDYTEPMSVDLDAWNQSQLHLLWNGGNRKLREFLSNYGLPDQNDDNYGADYTKYTTVACEYYRRWLAAQANGQPFNEVAPDYTIGRGQIVTGQVVGQWQEHGAQKEFQDQNQPLNQQNQESTGWLFAMRAAGAMKTGFSILATGAQAAKQKADETGVTKAVVDAKDFTVQKAEEYQLKEKTIAAGNYAADKAEEYKIKEKTIAAGKFAVDKAEEHKLKEKTIAAGNFAADKADEYRLKDKAKVAGEQALDTAKKTGNFIHQQGTEAQQQYESGNLAEHSKMKAKEAGQFIKATGQDMFAKTKNFFDQASDPQQQQTQPQIQPQNDNSYENQDPYQPNNYWG